MFTKKYNIRIFILTTLAVLLILLMGLVLIDCGKNKTTESNNEDNSLPPGTPHNPSPESSSDSTDLDVLLIWECSDPDDSELTYDVYFGIQADPPLVVSDISLNSYQVADLEYDTRYY